MCETLTRLNAGALLSKMRAESNNNMNQATSAEQAVNTVVVNDPLMALAENVDLETVLAAWHTATLRLERTHETLCGEVARLTKELEIKNRELAQESFGRPWPNGFARCSRSAQQPGSGFTVCKFVAT